MNGISHEEALKMVEENVENENLKKHMYAVASIMKKIAQEIEEDPEEWYKVGLLHDVDYGKTEDKPEKHGLISAQMLKDKLPEKSLKAIKSHNHENTDVKPSSKLDYALIAADAVSGLVVATALVMPNSKIEEVRVKSVLKKFDDSSFAKNIDRERIMKCEELGMNKEEFIELSLNALKGINEKLGL